MNPPEGVSSQGDEMNGGEEKQRVKKHEGGGIGVHPRGNEQVKARGGNSMDMVHWGAGHRN